jgi:hypothetical protein
MECITAVFLGISLFLLFADKEELKNRVDWRAVTPVHSDVELKL